PPVMTGNDGRALYPPQAELPFEEAIVRRLQRLDRALPPQAIKDIIAGIDPELVLKQVNAIEIKQSSDVLSALRNSLKTVPVRQVKSQSQKIEVKPIAFEDDPYDD
ncbi:MAG: ATP-binding protein, partial [Pseudanabaenaceae cyanobacterium]